MAQLTIYLDRETEKRVKNAAKANRLSVSRWARMCLDQAASPSQWPEDHFSVLGSLSGSPLPEPRRQPARGISL